MKKVFCLLIASILLVSLVSCGKTDKNDISVSSTNSSNENTTSSNVETDIAPGKYPVLFIDKTNHDDKAYVLCAVEQGKFLNTDHYKYNGKSIDEYLDGESVSVESDIFDISRALVFYDSKGNCYDAESTGLFCSSKDRLVDGTPEVLVDLAEEIPSEENWLIGSYSGVNLFDVKPALNDMKIIADLDNDGKEESVDWKFEKCNPEYSSEHYDYEISINLNDEVYTIKNDEMFPVEKDHLWLMVSDINFDGNKEIIVYKKALSYFGTVCIYQIKNGTTELVADFVIDPMP